MFRKVVIFSFLFAFMILLNGCASGRRQSDMEIQSLRNQITLLESQAQSKEEELSSLRGILNKPEAQREAIVEPWTRPKARDIQAALLNAGYNPGAVDGRIGRQTKEAIRAFQKANNLSADGKVGKKTWELLRGYLEKKVK
jgi:murein L,D-transpeptidase YcbB/YkuD